MPVTPRKISEYKPIIGNLAQTSHYLVQFGALPLDGGLRTYLLSRGIDPRFIAENAGLLCFNASLPTSSLATFTIDGNHMGIQEKFAHSRVYSSITLDFYVDKSYKMLNFLECWMEFISSGNRSISQSENSYFIRMQYPRSYKVDTVRIFKFDRDYVKEIEYNFRGLFPESISSVPVSYANSDILKVSATFSYDRYITGRTNSINQYLFRDSNNLQSSSSVSENNNIPNSQLTDEDILRLARETFRYSNSQTQDSFNYTISPSLQANFNTVISERRVV